MPVSYGDLAQRQDWEDAWADIEKKGGLNINTTLFLHTDIIESVEVPVSAKLRKPQILLQTQETA